MVRALCSTATVLLTSSELLNTYVVIAFQEIGLQVDSLRTVVFFVAIKLHVLTLDYVDLWARSTPMGLPC